MLLHIPAVLPPERLAECREALQSAEWADGRVTAGYMAAQVKTNLQVPEEAPVARRLGGMILNHLERHPMFISAALPLKVFPPMFNRYEGGGEFGNHIDTAIRSVPGTAHRVRTDLSATLFLNGPDEYDGGELMVEDSYGTHSVKLPAGDMVLYPGTSLHHVRPVTRGARIAAFFWIQSMVRDDGERTLLFDLDNSIQRLAQSVPADAATEQAALVRLTGVYHNLLRRWADA
jgi:PKHD-type hydroxylase